MGWEEEIGAGVKREYNEIDDSDQKLQMLCGLKRCEVCTVPLANVEASEKHYNSKIHGKKVERWRESYKTELQQKKMRLEMENPQMDFSPLIEEPRRSQERNCGQIEDSQGPTAEPEPELPMAQPLDPKMIDSMDPASIRRMLSGNAAKKSSRWETPIENEEEEEEIDPLDMSIPITPKALMKRCVNSVTGVGYCQFCNVLLMGLPEARKHFKGKKHTAKQLIYADLLLSEAAVLSGNAMAAPPPHRGHYCELCESDCSGQTQLDQHLSGERHRTNVRKMERELVTDPQLDSDINPYNLPEVWLRDRKQCPMCDVSIFSIRIAKIHFNCRSHRQAAGLPVIPSSLSKSTGTGKHICATCNFKTKTEVEMKVHNAGMRHMENERTKNAVEASGGEWRPQPPLPPDPPKHSILYGPQPGFGGGPGPGFGGWGWGQHGMNPGPHGMNPGPHGMNPGHHGMNHDQHGMAPGPHGMHPGQHGMGPGQHGMGRGQHGMGPGPHEMNSGQLGMGPCPQGMNRGQHGNIGMGRGPHGMPPGPHGMSPGPHGMGSGPHGNTGMGLGPHGSNFDIANCQEGGRPDDVTYKEFFCTTCKIQTANEREYQLHLHSQEHDYNELNKESYRCKVCKITCTALDDFNMHIAGPGHQHQVNMKQDRDRRRGNGEWVEYSDEEDEVEEIHDHSKPELVPYTEAEEKGALNPFHCPLCAVWLPTVPLLKFTHSSGEDHQAKVATLEETNSSPVVCGFCEIAANSVEEMLEKCLKKQKLSVFGNHRGFSCDMCDLHLSNQDWVDNHLKGEKHKWIADRVQKGLPVQWLEPQMQVMEKSQFDPFMGGYNYYPEFRCPICIADFPNNDKYRKHLGSLFHLRKCAGENVEWVQGFV